METNNATTISSTAAASSTSQPPSSDSLHGLKFGKKIYFENGAATTPTATASVNTSSSSSSLAAQEAPDLGQAVVVKRGKGGGHQQQHQPPRCQVEGCKLDLTGTKAYYCRHKVCGMHSKAPVVIVSGLEQRFCQQCSRFHQLPEFDQGKRSCRRRLAGHNERRRKPPAGPLSRYGRLASSFHEEPSRFRGFLMDFGYPRPLNTSTNTIRDAWPTSWRAGDRASSNQWQAILDPPSSAAAVHGANPYLPGPLSSSSCALSLLSTQTWDNNVARSRPPASYAGSSSLEDSSIVPITIPNDLLSNSWGFRAQGSRVSPQEIQHDMALGVRNATDAHFSGELELALQGNCVGRHGSERAYDHSNHEMHWSL